MRQEEFIKFCNSWMARDIDIAERANHLSPALQTKLESMFFRQGLSHSNQNTGFFTDQYQRCARIKDCSRSLLFQAIQSLSKKFAVNKTYLIPVCDFELAEIVCAANNPLVNRTFECTLRTVQLGKKKIICIQAKLNNYHENPTQVVLELLTVIAHRGILATRETLIEILLELKVIRYESVPHAQLDSSLVVHNQVVDISNILQLLRKSICMAEKLKENEYRSYEFFCNYLEVLIQGFCERFDALWEQVSYTEQRICQQAFKRVYLKLLVMQDLESEYKERIIALEFVFDEIVNLLSIAKLYNKSALFAAIQNFICSNMNLSPHEAPKFVALAGSCMQIIHRCIMEASRYFASKHNTKEIRTYIGSDIYYEVCQSYGITQDFQQDQYVIFSELQAKEVREYQGEIVDLMLLNFHANVNRSKSGFVGHDVEAIIQSQFQLRKMQGHSGQLIVVLDIAMTNLSDPCIKKLLANYTQHINDGRLAIILTTSLNKYCHNGFDRFPSGLSAVFYTQDNFHGLLPGNQLIGFEEYDVIPQTVAHCLKYAGSSVHTFYRMVHENSRNLHDNIVPNSLYNSKNPIYIDCPYTKDGYNRIWGFMVIRFSNERITLKYRPILESFLNRVGFEYRNGFGFNSSTYAFIGANLEILRISIGPNASSSQYKLLVNFLVLINSFVCGEETKTSLNWRFNKW